MHYAHAALRVSPCLLSIFLLVFMELAIGDEVFYTRLTRIRPDLVCPSTMLNAGRIGPSAMCPQYTSTRHPDHTSRMTQTAMDKDKKDKERDLRAELTRCIADLLEGNKSSLPEEEPTVFRGDQEQPSSAVVRTQPNNEGPQFVSGIQEETGKDKETQLRKELALGIADLLEGYEASLPGRVQNIMRRDQGEPSETVVDTKLQNEAPQMVPVIPKDMDKDKETHLRAELTAHIAELLEEHEESLHQKTQNVMDQDAQQRAELAELTLAIFEGQKGSLPSERVQNVIKRDHEELYAAVVGAQFKKKWNHFIQHRPDLFQLFSRRVRNGDKEELAWRIRLTSATNWEEVDREHEEMRADREIELMKKTLALLLQSPDHEAPVADVVQQLNEQFGLDPQATGSFLDCSSNRPRRIRRGDLRRLAEKYKDLMFYEVKKVEEQTKPYLKVVQDQVDFFSAFDA